MATVEQQTATSHYAERSPDKFAEDDELQFAEILPGFRIAVRDLFA
jgi:hypothetical protein